MRMLADVKHSVSLRLRRGKAQLDHFNGRDNTDYLVARAVLERGIGPCRCDEVVALFDARDCSMRLSATLAPCADAKTMLVVDAWAWFTGPSTDDDKAVAMDELRRMGGAADSSVVSLLCRRAMDALTHMLRVEVGVFWTLELFDGSKWHRSAIDMWQQKRSGGGVAVDNVLSGCSSLEARERRRASVLGYDFFS